MNKHPLTPQNASDPTKNLESMVAEHRNIHSGGRVFLRGGAWASGSSRSVQSESLDVLPFGLEHAAVNAKLRHAYAEPGFWQEACDPPLPTQRHLSSIFPCSLRIPFPLPYAPIMSTHKSCFKIAGLDAALPEKGHLVSEQVMVTLPYLKPNGTLHHTCCKGPISG